MVIMHWIDKEVRNQWTLVSKLKVILPSSGWGGGRLLSNNKVGGGSMEERWICML